MDRKYNNKFDNKQTRNEEDDHQSEKDSSHLHGANHSSSQYCYYHQGCENQQEETKLVAFKKLNIQCTKRKQGKRDDDNDNDNDNDNHGSIPEERSICAMHIVNGMIRHCRKRIVE